jgi:SAM-dependent methyltransferase
MSNEFSKTKFIIDPEFENRNKGTFYDNYYAQITNDAIKWRKSGVLEKCKSILELCRGLNFDKVVDIGAGLCGVISRLDELNFAPEFYAFEVSPSLIRLVKEEINIPRLKAVYLLDTSKTPFADNFFDLGILTHVVEHAAAPTELLSESLRICKHVLVEVPLEDCLLANAYSRISERMTSSKRGAKIGHLSFFNRSSIRNLITASGGTILKERNYHHWRIYPSKSRIRNALNLVESIILHLMFKITKSKLVSTYHALLIRKTNARLR